MYPALAVAEALNNLQPGVELTFVGSAGGFERPLVAASGVAFAHYDEVRAGPLHGVGVGRAARSLVSLAVGTLQALRLVARHRPQALLLTGGWVALPTTLAAWLRRVPVMIYLPDIEPGLTIRALRWFARRVAVTAPAACAHFRPGQAVVTGYPLRSSLRRATREAAVAHFGLKPDRRTLLVFGGSRGARAINYALLDIAPALLEDGVQIIHITGTLDWPELEARWRSLGAPEHYHMFAYLHEEMGLALAAADLVVSRAGASVLGEFPAFGLPAVLIPYPYAWRYQQVNADYLAGRGAALRLDEAQMAARLLPTIRELLGDPARLATMRAAAAALAVPDAAARAAAELARLAGEGA